MSDAQRSRLALSLVIFAALGWSGCEIDRHTSFPPTVETHETELPEPRESGPLFPIPTDYLCSETLILEWPVIDSAAPDPASPASTVELIGHGGVVHCGNAYDESSRDFAVFLEDQRIGSINCYVNHCEGEIQLPQDLEPGEYGLSVSPEDLFMLGVQ